MTENCDLKLPDEPYRLEEANLPAAMVPSMAGRSVVVDVVPEEPMAKLDSGSLASTKLQAGYIDPDGNLWKGYRPTQIHLADSRGHVWHLARKWIGGTDSGAHLPPSVPTDIVFSAKVNLPSEWDLLEIDLTKIDACRAGGRRGAFNPTSENKLHT
jgi:hypothetical protein